MSNDSVFKKLQKKLHKVDDKFVDEFTDQFIEKVTLRTPYPPGFNPGSGKKVTGNLKKGWDSKKSGNTVTIFNDVEYAEYVEKGTDKMRGAHMLLITGKETGLIAKKAYNKVKGK
jgi:hypothetical protein